MKSIITLVSIVILISASFIASAEDTAGFRETMESQIMGMCEESDLLSCLGISKKKCVSSVKKSTGSCSNLFPKDTAGNESMMNEAMTAYGDCVHKNILKNTGVSEDKANSCDKEADAQQPQSMEEGMAMFNQAMQQHAQMMGTDGVTLPMYKNATVMSHISGSQGAQMLFNMTGEMYEGALPALTMASPDDASKIVDYYQNNLKGFSKIKVDDGVLFIKSKQKDFDLLRDMKVFATTPHVMITSMQAMPGIPGNTKSKIEIGYQK